MSGPPPLTPWGEPGGSAAEIAGQAAHDLNNVLTILAGNIALAERHAAGNPKLIRLLNTMRLAVDRGTALATRLLALAPQQDQAFGLSEEQAASLRPPKGRSRILVVEDDPHVAELAVAVLEDMGHLVELRADAASALAALESAGSFDLVFSDIVMPGGMSGIDLAEAIARSFPRLPILLATGFSSAALAPEALRFPILAKPYSVHELTRRVVQMLPQD